MEGGIFDKVLYSFYTFESWEWLCKIYIYAYNSLAQSILFDMLALDRNEFRNKRNVRYYNVWLVILNLFAKVFCYLSDCGAWECRDYTPR